MAGPIFDGKALISVGELPGLRLVNSGKVRDVYEVDAEYLLMVSTDRISAFDVIMKNGVPGKGKVLNQLTVFWLTHFASEGLTKHHLVTADVGQMPEVCKAHAALLAGRSMLVRRLKMLPIEAIVRGYITGSGWKDYKQTGTVCGHALPPALKHCERLPQPLFTPSTKAEAGEHDENITVSQASATLGEEEASRLEQKALALYGAASAFAEPRGILLADSKMEFGLGEDGELVLGDECFTPDCSRYWPSDGYEVGKEQDSFDKQYVRNYLLSIEFDKKTPQALPEEVISKTLDKYTQIFTILTGSAPVL